MKHRVAVLAETRLFQIFYRVLKFIASLEYLIEFNYSIKFKIL